MVWSLQTVGATYLYNKSAPVNYSFIYQYTGTDQTINIPSNISSNVNIKCWGAGGATQGFGILKTMYQTGWGGGGGYTEANFTRASMAGQTLTIIVGQGGQTTNSTTITANTYGGGGGQGQNWGVDANWGSASGGGRSAVRLPGPIEIITAGGGGGGGGTLRASTTASSGVGSGGAGGGLTGGNAQYASPLPGLSTVNADVRYDGSGGTPSVAGRVGINSFTSTAGTIGGQFYGGFGALYGAGGGGGYFGGGCGGISYTSGTNQFIFGGGGGGSSYVNTSYGTQVNMLQGSNNTVAGTAFFPSGYTSSTIGSGGAQSAANRGTNGNAGLPGLVVISYTV
jgi:hypothetical protein